MKCAEDDVCECRGKTNGIGEGGDWELVLARLDWRSTEMCKSTIGVESVKLLLGLNSGEGIDDKLLDAVAADAVARHIVCDVVDEIGEEGDLEQLVEGNELKAGQGVCCDGSWRWTIGQSSLGSDLDGGQLRRWIGDVGETVGQREIRGAR